MSKPVIKLIQGNDGRNYLDYSVHADRLYPGVSKYRQHNDQRKFGYHAGLPGKTVRRQYWADSKEIIDQVINDLSENNNSHCYGNMVFADLPAPSWYDERFIVQRIKFCDKHFPVGTQFICEDLHLYSDPDASKTIHTVVGIYRTNSDNWVLETSTPCVTGEGRCSGFAISHVTRIIKRGDGAVASTDRTLCDEDMSYLWWKYSTETTIGIFISREYPKIAFQVSEEFVRKVMYRFYHKLNKDGSASRKTVKSIKKYIKQNINRGLNNLKSIKKEEEAFETAFMNDLLTPFDEDREDLSEDDTDYMNEMDEQERHWN